MRKLFSIFAVIAALFAVNAATSDTAEARRGHGAAPRFHAQRFHAPRFHAPRVYHAPRVHYRRYVHRPAFYAAPVVFYGGGCAHLYRQWQLTGYPVWKHRYYRCKGW